MLSEQDYKNYLEQIIQLENKMSDIYNDCSNRLEEDFIKKVSSALSKAEKGHALIVKELIDLFDLKGGNL